MYVVKIGFLSYEYIIPEKSCIHKIIHIPRRFIHKHGMWMM